LTDSTRFFAVAGPEATYGATQNLSDFKKIRVTGIGDPVNRNPSFEEAIDISVATYAVGGPLAVNGTIDALLRFNSFAPLFNSLLGATNVSGDYYLSDTPQSYNFLIGDDQANTQVLYTGAGISSMELTLAVREFVRARMTWIARKPIILSKSSFVTPDWYTAPSNDPAAVYYNAVVKVGDTPIKAKNITLRIDRKFDTDYHFVGSPLLQGLYMNAQTELGGTMTLGGGEWTLLNQVLAGSATGDQITTATGDITTVGTDTKNELGSGSFEIDLFDLNGNKVGSIHAGTCVYSESNRTVTGRNQWDKSVNYRIVVPTIDAFYISPGA